jgi:hypothetical protein
MRWIQGGDARKSMKRCDAEQRLHCLVNVPDPFFESMRLAAQSAITCRTVKRTKPKETSSWRELEFAMQGGGGAFSDPKVELFWFNDPLFLSRAPELQFVGAQLEVNSLFCA